MKVCVGYSRSVELPPSPKIQRSASRMLLLPLPLGPTMAVSPLLKMSSQGAPKLLKPLSLRDSMDNGHALPSLHLLRPALHGVQGPL